MLKRGGGQEIKAPGSVFQWLAAPRHNRVREGDIPAPPGAFRSPGRGGGRGLAAPAGGRKAEEEEEEEGEGDGGSVPELRAALRAQGKSRGGSAAAARGARDPPPPEEAQVRGSQKYTNSYLGARMPI